MRRRSRGVIPARAAAILVMLLALSLPSCGDPRDASLSRDARAVCLSVGSLGSSPGSFRQPRAVTVDARGRFYVVDREARVQFFARDGTLLAHWRMPEFKYGQPTGLQVEGPGRLLLSDSHYQRIFRYDVSSLDGGASPEAPMSEAPESEAPVPEALTHEEIALHSWGKLGKAAGEFTWARDVIVDSRGDIYVGDTGGFNDRIQKFSSEGQFITTWGNLGSEPGQFDHPAGMTIERRDGEEFLLVADLNNHRIQRFDLGGKLVSVWGQLGTAVGKLRYPRSVVTDTSGYIYVCEWGNNRVQKFDADGVSLGTWGKAGRGLGELYTPWDLEVSEDGRIYVVDYGNHRVQVFEWPAAS